MKIYWDGENKNIIGDRLKMYRKAKNLTQKQLAYQLQLSGHEFNELTILRIEHKTRFVSDMEIVALADYFGISTDELLGVEEK